VWIARMSFSFHLTDCAIGSAALTGEKSSSRHNKAASCWQPAANASPALSYLLSVVSLSSGAVNQPRSLLQAGGLIAISRWLSEATPPEWEVTTTSSKGRIPEGCQRHTNHLFAAKYQGCLAHRWHPSGTRPLSDVVVARLSGSIGLRPRPPANRCQASGLKNPITWASDGLLSRHSLHRKAVAFYALIAPP
jgi:hypothetical protein